MECTRIELMPAVHLTCVQTDKFKTGCLSINLLRQLNAKEASKNALIPRVLCRGCTQYPDMHSLSAVFNSLYDMSVTPYIRKKGETHCIGLYSDFPDSAYIPEKDILKRAVEMLCQLLIDPVTRRGLLLSEYVLSEREKLCDDIRSKLNDKREYAISRLLESMCADEAYGIGRLGTLEEAAKINAVSLTKYYRKILAESPIEIFYCGTQNIDTVSRYFISALSALPRVLDPSQLLSTEVITEVGDVRCFEDEMDIAQGKLVLGFRLGSIMRAPNHAAIMVFNTIYGSGVNSKLFLNVREKLSLCYYVGSVIEEQKGIMIVSSGIDVKKYDQAKDEILTQLDNCKKGEFSADELSMAKRTVISSICAMMDSSSGLENYYLGQITQGLNFSPEELQMMVQAVTKEQVVSVAESIQLDSIYFLHNVKEAGQ